jgi:3-oxoacyl-[acyl-carrier-protein] synthase II
MPSDVVVTGIGVVSAAGIGVDSFWDSLRDGKSGITSLEHRDDDGPKPPADWRQSVLAKHWIGGPVIGFDAAQFVRPRKALKVMCRELQTAFAASQMAMEQAGLAAAIEKGDVHKDHVATIFGSQMLYGPASELLDAVKNSMNGDLHCDIAKFGTAAMRDIMPLWMLKYLPNMAACHVGISIGATGPNNTIVAGDVSAMSAMIESIGALRRGNATAVVCGATGSRIDETYLVYRGDSPVAQLADDVSHGSRPHAVDASGIVPAEAASALIIETRQSALARGATPLVSIQGFASRFAKPTQGKRSSALAIQLAIEGALMSADRKAADIGVVFSHGTGDPQRDEAERIALTNALPGVAICAPIAITGHSGASATGVNTVAAILSLIHETIPAQPQHGAIHPAIAPRFSDRPRPLKQPTALVLSHNSQGNANALVLVAQASSL